MDVDTKANATLGRGDFFASIDNILAPVSTP